MPAKKTRKVGLPTVSAVLAEGGLVELLYDAKKQRTSFAVWEHGVWRETDSIYGSGQYLVSYASESDLLRHEVVLLPSEPEDYGSYAELVSAIRGYIKRYVDLSEGFEVTAAHYVLLTWLFDTFNELPYLRMRGDYGTGKTRFLQIVGSICYRPIFVSGASTVSPIFHLLDTLGGTLILDEADFRFSDEKAELVKILNNGNMRGMPILRSQMARQREFEPRVFNVYGPKLVAMRTRYDDDALESRFFTEEAAIKGISSNVPINLPATYRDEALILRNKLLMYRFRNWGKFELTKRMNIRGIETRTYQLLAPLLAVAVDAKSRGTIQSFVSGNPAH